jgi:hypothetical protein
MKCCEECEWMDDLEAKQMFTGPMCLCGSTNTKREGKSALNRRCLDCGRAIHFRITHAGFAPLSDVVARALDEERARRVA